MDKQHWPPCFEGSIVHWTRRGRSQMTIGTSLVRSLCRHSTWPRTRPIEGNASSYSTSTMLLAQISFRHGTGERSAQTFTWRKERSCAQFAPITSTLRPWET